MLIGRGRAEVGLQAPRAPVIAPIFIRVANALVGRDAAPAEIIAVY